MPDSATSDRQLQRSCTFGWHVHPTHLIYIKRKVCMPQPLRTRLFPSCKADKHADLSH